MIPVREEHCYFLFLLIPANAVLLLSLEVVHMPFLLWKYPHFSFPWMTYPLRSALVLQRLHRSSSFGSRCLACALLSFTWRFVETLNGIGTTSMSLSSPRLCAPPVQGDASFAYFCIIYFLMLSPVRARWSGINEEHRKEPHTEALLTRGWAHVDILNSVFALLQS